MQRRDFLRNSAAALTGASLLRLTHATESARLPAYTTSSSRWQKAYDAALELLQSNVQVLPRFDRPVLIEGAEYAGIWQECAPQESLVYSVFRLNVARNTHMAFFALQREDGQLPCANKRAALSFGQLQMVVPIAATAWELSRRTGDEELLRTAYSACTRWDAWLMRYRNTRGTGLIEGFCTYDTGHDNSPRWKGIPNRSEGNEARNCPKAPGLPRLCPDLSASVYGARCALAEMATALGHGSEAVQWQEQAEVLRRKILKKLWVPEEAAFYDLDSENQFVRVRSDVLSRVCGEHVMDPQTFERIWQTQLHNAKAFWGKYPLTSIAMDDPGFVRPIPRNSWGGAAQALTALRAPRWMEFYGKSAELGYLMGQWCEAMVRQQSFRQQMDPETGEFTLSGSGGYSPAALCMMDFTWRLAGVREEGEELEWNLRPKHEAAQGAIFALPLRGGHRAELHYAGKGLLLDQRSLARVEGTARLVTDRSGKPLRLVGISEGTEEVLLRIPGKKSRSLRLKSNESIAL